VKVKKSLALVQPPTKVGSGVCKLNNLLAANYRRYALFVLNTVIPTVTVHPVGAAMMHCTDKGDSHRLFHVGSFPQWEVARQT
jgi:hypothetical protein